MATSAVPLVRPRVPVSFSAASGSTMLRLWKARIGVWNRSAPSRKNGRFSVKKSGKRWLAVLWGWSASTSAKSGLTATIGNGSRAKA